MFAAVDPELGKGCKDLFACDYLTSQRPKLRER